MDHIATFKELSEEIFNELKRESRRTQVNLIQSPCILAKSVLCKYSRNLLHRRYIQSILEHFSHYFRDVRDSVLDPLYWPIAERLAMLDGTKKEDMLHFADTFRTRLQVFMLVQGNIRANTAIDLAIYLERTLKSEPLIPNSVLGVGSGLRNLSSDRDQHNKQYEASKLITKHIYSCMSTFSCTFQSRLCQLPVGQFCCRIRNQNPTDVNSCIQDYYQYGPATISEACLVDCIVNHLSEGLFDILRTKEQLGYRVECSMNLTRGIVGFLVRVDTQSQNFRFS